MTLRGIVMLCEKTSVSITGGRSRAAKVGPRPCRHHEVLSGWGFRQPNPPTPKIYFLLGFRPLNLENVEIKMRVFFT